MVVKKPKIPRLKIVRVTDAKEVGMGNPAEETTATQTFDLTPEGEGLSIFRLFPVRAGITPTRSHKPSFINSNNLI